jgi:DNA-binding HxlR family transcriptional regulator
MFKPFCLQFLDFLSEKLSKKWVILIVCKAVFRVLTFGEVAAADIPCALLFAGHE